MERNRVEPQLVVPYYILLPELKLITMQQHDSGLKLKSNKLA